MAQLPMQLSLAEERVQAAVRLLRRSISFAYAYAALAFLSNSAAALTVPFIRMYFASSASAAATCIMPPTHACTQCPLGTTLASTTS